MNCRKYEHVTLHKVLADLSEEELLEGQNFWECGGCKRKVEATKTCSIGMLPPVVVVHFKRFDYDFASDAVVKMCGDVRLGDAGLDGLDLGQYTASREEILYDVTSIVNHHGPDTVYGHYTVHCRHAVDGRWHKYDDDSNYAIDASAAWLPDCAYVV